MNNRTQEKTQQHLITKESLRTSISTRAKTPCCGSTTTKENNDQIASSSTAETEPATVVNSATKPRCRRQWEQWSWEEKKCFYEGLAEYGKDYSKIQSFMNKKLKLKNYSDGKTKEQIRFFYHRTWSKIAKKLNLQPEEDSKKACRRELHYLLCLGELRKKQSAGFGAKVMKQLDELATKGITYVRLNGRNLRVRPPNRYLRKIYKDISDSPEIQLPKTVTIEFLPNSNMAFNFVQKHAFNPRIRFTGVSINARFSEVFEMLNKRFMDVYTNTNLNLQIYPMQSDTDFSKLLSNAIELLATYDKTQVTDIVVEKDKPKDNLLVEDVTIETTCTDKEHHQMELEQVLPQIFAKHGEKETPDGGSSEKGTTLKKSNSFPGYWTYIDAKEIFLRTLFVVFEQKPVFKFKYEWKQSVDESVDNCTFNKMALQNLAKLCDVKKEEDSVPQTDSRMSVISPLLQSPNFLYARKPGEGAISTTHQDGHGLMNGTSGKWVLPNRPRPGRINKSRQQLGNNIAGVTSPLLALSSGKAQCKTVLNNAVAVNLIPQHQQNLLHMAHLQHNSNKLVNNSASTVVHGVQDEVIAEGFQEHYQALANMIKSSALVKGQRNNENNNLHKTPVKVNPIPSNIPASPNLEWLNETVDISMTSFLNVCDMQALQNKRQAMQSKNTASSLHNNLKPNVSLDPVLPKFESSEISQGPLYDLAFELSNHATKSKDQYTVT